MPRIGHCLPDGPDVVDDPGRGVDLDRKDRLDPGSRVGAQAIPHRIRIDGAARRGAEQFHIEAEDGGHLGPGAAEHSALKGEHPVAPAEAIHERRLPRAVTVRGVHEGLGLCPDDFLEIFNATHCHIDNLTGIEVDCGTVHRGKHLVGHGGRTRDGEKFTAASDSHEIQFPECGGGNASWLVAAHRGRRRRPTRRCSGWRKGDRQNSDFGRCPRLPEVHLTD